MKLDEIWGSYRSSLKAFLHSKISNPSDVEDVLQEILIKTHSNIDSLKRDESIKSWIFQIANRATIDFYRRQGVLSEMNSEVSSLWQSDNYYDVKTTLARCVDPFLSALPIELADLLRAVDIEGKPQKALAKELGISYSTLKSRVQKGRIQLKALFDKCCFYKLDQQGNLVDFEQKYNPCKKC